MFTAATVYKILPECGMRQCRVMCTEDIRTPRWLFQHGDNPEAVLLTDRFVAATDNELHRRLRAWTERIHRYEDGEGDGK